MIAPAVIALLIFLSGAVQGCGVDAPACDGGSGLGAAYGFMLDWAWRRVVDWPILAILVIAAAAGAGFGFETRMQAIMAGAMGACWGPIAALVLPYLAIGVSVPSGCRIIESGAPNCVIWGHAMGMAFGSASVAFGQGLLVLPIAFAGMGLTFLFAMIHRRQTGQVPPPTGWK